MRILGSFPVPLSLAGVRKRFLQPCEAPRNRIQKRSPRNFLVHRLSTKLSSTSCTKVINFSTVERDLPVDIKDARSISEPTPMTAH